jgi:hypothetical protein
MEERSVVLLKVVSLQKTWANAQIDCGSLTPQHNTYSYYSTERGTSLLACRPVKQTFGLMLPLNGPSTFRLRFVLFPSTRSSEGHILLHPRTVGFRALTKSGALPVVAPDFPIEFGQFAAPKDPARNFLSDLRRVGSWSQNRREHLCYSQTNDLD